MNIKDCKGCRSEVCIHTDYGRFKLCSILYRHKLKEFNIPMCPCSECLIKMMCAEGCDPYMIYMSIINKKGSLNPYWTGIDKWK